MKFAGCDLHKQSITVCVVDQSREVLVRRRMPCGDEAGLVRFFAELGEFEAVVETTASDVGWVERRDGYEPRTCATSR